MPKAIVASFGFDERFVVRAIIKHGIGLNDYVLLVSGKAVDKTLDAFNYVKDLASKVGAKVELFELGDAVYSFPDLVCKCLEILAKLLGEYSHVTILLSGGMRVIVLGLYTAALLLPKEYKDRISIEIDTEDKGAEVTIPNELTKIVQVADVSQKRAVIEALIEAKNTTVEELTQKLKRDDSTIRRHIYTLAEMGLVKIDRDRGKQQRMVATETLKIINKLMQLFTK